MAVTTEHALQFKIRRYDLDASSITPRLDGDEVHVWHLALGDLSSDTALFKKSLSADELERASRFRFEKHRAQFVLTRGTLRSLLGSYLEVSPREISFQYSKHDKPSLAEAANLRNIHFNVSHTEGMAIFGFTLAGRIGVDIESLRTDFHAEEIAERFFSASERSALREIPAPARYESFFRIWTRKEAYIKALGEGLSHPLHEFDVSFDEAAALLATRPDGAEAERWHLENLAIAPGFIAAAAVETDARLRAPHSDEEAFQNQNFGLSRRSRNCFRSDERHR